MPRPPASLHPQPLPDLPRAQLPAMTFIPDEDSEAGRGIVTARIAGPLRGPARAGPGCLALLLVLKDMSAVGAPGSEGGGSFQSGPGRGTRGWSSSRNCEVLSHLLPAGGQEEGTAKEG